MLMDLMQRLWKRAAKNKKTIILPEGEEERIIVACGKILRDDVAKLILIGDSFKIKSKAKKLGVDLGDVKIVNNLTSNRRGPYADKLYELRMHKGMTPKEAAKMMDDPIVFGIMMLKMDEADGLVSGAIHTTKALLKPALQIIKAAPDVSLISSFFIMITSNRKFGDNGILLFADCGLNENPTAEQLADIAISTSKTAEYLCDMDPRVALLSFSTKGSADNESVRKVRTSLDIAKTNDPDLIIDGELQLDAALIPSVASQKAPGSSVEGQANVLIFPNLDAGNIGYKLVERFGKAQAIGPLCQGFAKPVNDLSRGCTADDIAKSIVVTAVQAQNIIKK